MMCTILPGTQFQRPTRWKQSNSRCKNVPYKCLAIAFTLSNMKMNSVHILSPNPPLSPTSWCPCYSFFTCCKVFLSVHGLSPNKNVPPLEDDRRRSLLLGCCHCMSLSPTRSCIVCYNRYVCGMCGVYLQCVTFCGYVSEEDNETKWCDCIVHANKKWRPNAHKFEKQYPHSQCKHLFSCGCSGRCSRWFYFVGITNPKCVIVHFEITTRLHTHLHVL